MFLFELVILFFTVLFCVFRWKDKNGDKATAKVLKRALEDMRLMGVVSKYFDV